jgi:predicted RNA binding protein YcfA (HicA-like mRNA interferase family)
MSQKLPMISGRECVDALTKAGFYFVRQKGSHMYLRRDEPFAQISIPNHKELDKGTLKSIIWQADLTVDEFIALL